MKPSIPYHTDTSGLSSDLHRAPPYNPYLCEILRVFWPFRSHVKLGSALFSLAAFESGPTSA